MQYPNGPPTGIEVKLGFFPLAFMFLMCTPIVEVDGYPVLLPWGTHFLSIVPGRHFVKIYFQYMFMSHCGANSIEVMVQPGLVNRISFYMPPLIFLPGSLTEY